METMKVLGSAVSPGTEPQLQYNVSMFSIWALILQVYFTAATNVLLCLAVAA